MANKPGSKFELMGADELTRFFNGLDAKMQRDALRKSVAAGGNRLARELRKRVRGLAFSRASRSKGGSGHHPGKEGAGLARSVKVKTWNIPLQGLLGKVVRWKWPEGAHGHLIESGHRVWSHGNPTAARSKAYEPHKDALEAVGPEIMKVQEAAVRKFLTQQRGKGTL
jgi:hypothetical protein